MKSLLKLLPDMDDPLNRFQIGQIYRWNVGSEYEIIALSETMYLNQSPHKIATLKCTNPVGLGYVGKIIDDYPLYDYTPVTLVE